MGFNEILCEYYAIREQASVIYFNYIKVVKPNNNIANAQNCENKVPVAPLSLGI
jgi:hypothetical protein